MKKHNSIWVLSLSLALFFIASDVFAQGGELRGREVFQEVRQEVRTEQEEEADEPELEVEVETETRGRGTEHRSEVAEAVERLLYIADRNGGIGEEIRKIAREQASSSEDIARAVERVEERNEFKTFLIGTDYKNLGMIRSELVKMDARIASLGREVEKLIPFEQETIRAEIVTLETERERLQKFIEDNEGNFSLFGWLARLLTR